MSDLDVFEDALFTVFGHHQPARGDPGSIGSYSHQQLPTWCEENGGKQLQYRIADLSSTNTKLFAHHQWDAGVYLADIVCEQCEWADVRGQQVVELGAGTGLPSLAAAAVGAKRTIVTDYPDPDLLANLKQNVARLKSRAPCTLALDVEGVAWGQDLQTYVTNLTRRFVNRYGQADYVLAADVLWVSSMHAALLETVCTTLKRSDSARFLLVAGFHTGRPAIARFLRAARDAGLVFAKDAPYEGVYERCISGEKRAYRSIYDLPHEDEEMGDISERAQWVIVAIFRWPTSVDSAMQKDVLVSRPVARPEP